MEEQRAVLSLCSGEDPGVRRQRALWQGTAGPQVAGDDLLVQAQLAGDAVEGLRVQIQDGDGVGERRRPGGVEVPEPPLSRETGRPNLDTKTKYPSSPCRLTGLYSVNNTHPSSSSSSLLGTRATMMEQSLAVMATRYWWT